MRWVEARAWTTRDAAGNPLRFEGVVRDITERKATELALQESESRLRFVMELGRIGMWELDAETRQTYWSPALRKLCGVDENYVTTAESFWKLVHPDDVQEVIKGNGDLAKGRTTFPAFRIIRPDGTIRWLQNIGHVRREAEKFVGVLVDVTEAKEAEQLIEEQKANIVAASKLSDLGEMAAGLAHEINNPVAIIHGHATLLKHVALHGGEPGVIRKTAEVVEQTADRISKITRSLLAFARDAGQDPFEPTSIKSLVSETAEFCRQRFRQSGVQLKIEPISPELQIDCRPGQISQVLLNLLNNAFDAVEKSEKQEILIMVDDKGEEVEISVADSGSGIPAELHGRIFQPFFTTKEVGRGTGLGLSVASGIVQSHAGRLTFATSPRGTRFTAILPKRR
jgi:PAS domain S-box-containing protein